MNIKITYMQLKGLKLVKLLKNWLTMIWEMPSSDNFKRVCDCIHSSILGMYTHEQNTNSDILVGGIKTLYC